MDIDYFKKPRGDSPVENFIESLEEKHKTKVLNDLENLEKFGHQHLIKTGDVENFKGYKNLYQLTTNWKRVGCRIFFSILENKIWLLHSFKKKSQKTRNKEINKALNNKNILIKELKSKNKNKN